MRLARAPSLAGFLFGAAASLVAANDWKGIAPEGGSVRAIAVDPRDASHLYIGLDYPGGGIFRSNDGGESWADLAPSLFRQQIASLAIRPDDGTVYAGTSAGVYRISPSGGAPEPLGPPSTVNEVRIHPKTPTTIYAATDNGVFVSTDGGSKWIEPKTFFTAKSIAIDPTITSVLYAGTTFDTLYKTVDGALSWKLLATNTSGRFLKLEVDPANSQHLLAATDGGLEVSQDGGAHWGLAPDLPTSQVTSILFRGDTTYLGTAIEGVYRSTNGGANWSITNANPSSLSILSIAQGNDPGDPLIAGTAIGVFRSDDGGISWSEHDHGLVQTDVVQIAIDPSNSAVVYAGLTYPLGGGTPFLHTETGGVIRSSDHGDHWSPISPPFVQPDFITDIVIDPSSPATLYAGTERAAVIKSIDSGATWSPAGDGFENDDITSLAIDPSDSSVLYAGTIDSSVHKTVDGGGHWTKLAESPYRAYSLAIDPRTGAIYSGDWYRGLDTSTDGGTHWQIANEGLPPIPSIFGLALDPQRPATLFAADADSVGNSGTVFESRDRAAHWYPHAGNAPPVWFNSLALDSRTRRVYLATAGAGIYFSLIPYTDVPPDGISANAIDAVTRNGITLGCGQGNFCPDDLVTRAQMAIFILRGEHGGFYRPPPATGTVFTDVPSSAFGAAWIDQLSVEKISSGCGNGNFCPDDSVARDQMAVFLLRGKNGGAYKPPAAVGGVFSDVTPATYLAAWIEQMPAQGISSGCGGGNYCPTGLVSRAQMASFLVRAFGLKQLSSRVAGRELLQLVALQDVAQPLGRRVAAESAIEPKRAFVPVEHGPLDARGAARHGLARHGGDERLADASAPAPPPSRRDPRGRETGARGTS